MDKTDSLESTFHAFKDTVAFIINITVVIPSDETIGRIMNSLEAKGESFDGLHSVWICLLNWDAQLRYANRLNTEYHYKMWLGLMQRSEWGTLTVQTYDTEALNYRNDERGSITTAEMRSAKTITTVIDYCIQKGICAYGYGERPIQPKAGQDRGKRQGVSARAQERQHAHVS